MARGRWHTSELRVGDALDFWQVLDVVQEERLLLLAEMKVPGEALLELKIESIGDGYTDMEMLSRFFPKDSGECLIGRAYTLFMKRFFSGC